MVRRPSRIQKPGRGKVGTSKGGTAIRVAKDGKVEAPCPQCGTVYRVLAENLDQVIKCQECGKVFPARHTAGRRAHAPDYTKAYVVFGIAALGLVAMFAVLASGDKQPAKTNPTAKANVSATTYTVGTHPRCGQLLRWAEAVAGNNRLVLQTHTDLNAVGKLLGAPYGEADAALKAIASNPLTAPLRELSPVSAVLASDADMTAPTGTGILFVVPKAGDARYRKDTRGELEVTFRKESDEQILVTGWRVKTEPVRNSGQPKQDETPKPADAGLGALAGDKPAAVEITDSAGTRKVSEVEPRAMGHWEKATPEQQKFADQIVADILFSLSNETGAAGKFTRATLSVRTLDEASAVVPRILNAMFELYQDPIANHEKLNHLNKALATIVGWSVNYQVQGTGDDAKDKAERQSCVRQWFGWYKQNQANVLRYKEAEETGDEPR